MTLSDPRCVVYLIKHRSQIYPKDRAMTHFSELMVAIYIDLDRLIESTPLTRSQRMTIRYLMEGYTSQDLGELWNVSHQTIDHCLRKAAAKMSELNSARHWEMLEKKYRNTIIKANP